MLPNGCVGTIVPSKSVKGTVYTGMTICGFVVGVFICVCVCLRVDWSKDVGKQTTETVNDASGEV